VAKHYEEGRFQMKGKKFLAVLLVALLVLAALPTMALAATFSLTKVVVVDGVDGYTTVEIPKVGQKLTANIYTNDAGNPVIGSYPVNEDAEYKWYYEGSEDNVLGTGATYTVTSDNAGKKLCVTVSVKGYDGTETWTASEAASYYEVTDVDVVDGVDGYTPVTAPKAGQKLTANIETDDPANPVIGSYPVNEDAQYKWYYEGSDNVLGTGATYTVTSDNIGKILCVDVSVKGYDGTETWTATDAAAKYKVTKAVVVDGTDGYTAVTTPEVGQKLTANIETDDPANPVIGSYPVNEDAQYKWYYKGSDNVLGTGATYTVTSDNIGKILCVDVSVNGYDGMDTWEANVIPEPRYEVIGVTVVGEDGATPVTEPKVGQILTANIFTDNFMEPVIGSYPVNKDAQYKWYYEGSDNILGTAPTYTVTSDNIDKTLCVEVSVKGYSGSAVWTAEVPVTDARIPGDVNGDGIVDLLDMVQINNVKNGTAEFDDEAFQAADMNGDGIIDLLDLVLVNNIRLNK
jgi:YHS domain-containing protein